MDALDILLFFSFLFVVICWKNGCYDKKTNIDEGGWLIYAGRKTIEEKSWISR